MLHSLPALLDELEQRLIQGVDPQPLLNSLRWPEVVNWPSNQEEARRIKSRLQTIQTLLNGLQAPLRATLMALSDGAPYAGRGQAAVVRPISLRVHQSV